MDPEYILVVDDDADVRDLIELTLCNDGYLVKTAPDGQQALALLADYSFSLVITDLMMPNVSGLEILVEVKSRFPTAEVILLTAHGSLESAVTALQQGAHDYITKPFSQKELSHSVERALSYRRLKLEKTELLANLQQHNDELLRMLEASNRLSHLRPQPGQLLAEIVDIAQQQLGLTIAITALDSKGKFLQAEVASNFQKAWYRALTDRSLTEKELRQLITGAPRISHSYVIEPEQDNFEISWLTPEIGLPTTPLLAAPLETHGGRLLGMLWVTQVEHTPPMGVIQRVEIFANQVIGVLENANLFTAQTHQVRVRNALVEAGQRIATVLNRAEVIQTVLEATLKIMPEVELAVVFYRPSLQAELSAAGLTGAKVKVDSFPFDRSLVTKALHDKQTVYQPAWQDNSDQAEKSLIIEPLVLAGVPLGALAVISRQSTAFDEDQRQVLAMLANQATIALQNARLYAEARKMDELAALHEAGKAISRTLDLQETLTTTMAISRSLTGASISNIYLYTPDHHRIDSVVTLGENLALSDIDRRRSTEIAQTVLESQRPSLVIEPEIITEPFDLQKMEVGKRVIQAWLAVPLPTTNSPAGVLELGSERAGAFAADDVRLMQIIASQAAAAIENARLYEESQRRLQQTEALSVISQSISTTLDLHRVLELVVHSAAKTIPVATHSVLYLRDQAQDLFVPEARVANQNYLSSPELETARKKAIEQASQQQDAVRASWQSEEHGPWSLLVAPLKVGQSVIGAICVESPHGDAFLANDETLLKTFASHASIAIQNANLFQELSSAYSDLANKQAEILRSHRTLQALFDSITDGLYIVDQDLRVIAINQAETKRLGKTAEALLGQSCNVLWWGEATAAVTKIILETFETGEEGNWESQLDVIERGPFTNRDVRTYPIFKATGEVSQVIVFAQDVSEKRRLQASLFRSANLAAVGQLASSIAHQINNPLTVIIANAQIMEMDMEPRSPDYPIMTHIVEAGIQIREIVQNLLDFSTQDSYDWFETNIDETLNDALTLVTHSLRKSDIRVVKQVEELPAIIASKSHIKLLWMNLLLNARDAISAGKEAGVIKICATQATSDYIQIQIRDNGIGILPQHRDRLFHPFFTTKTTGKNLGLGLYTCRSIVEAHHGQIEIDKDHESSDTVVTVTLPIHDNPHSCGNLTTNKMCKTHS